MKAVEIEWWEGGMEICLIRPGKTHGESHVDIPFAMRQTMYGCREFGRYRMNFLA